MPFTLRTLLIAALLLVGAIGGLLAFSSGRGGENNLVVYTSVDAEFALPLFEQFTKETGINVVPRTDGESSKTTAMAERLLQMKERPDGDVFWNSELSQTLLLAKNGVFQPYAAENARSIPAEFKDTANLWTGFGCRARVLVYNTNKLRREELPQSLEELADPKWKGRFLVAKPLFGTTRSHLVSFAIVLGEEKAFELFRAWRANGVVIAESNGDVRNRVAQGTFDLGLTDTDDVFSAMDRKKPVDYVVPDQTRDWRGAYLIPNTVSMLKNCSNPAAAKKFIDYLLKPETEAWLAKQGARQIPVRDVGVEMPEALKNLKPANPGAESLAEKVLPLGEKIYRILLGEENHR